MTTLLDEPSFQAETSLDVPAGREGSRFEHIWQPLRSMARMAAARVGVPLSRVFGPRHDGTFGVLMYHRISVHFHGASAPTWNVTPERFRSQLLGLLACGYRPWPLKKMLRVQADGERVPARVFVVTFDDGYANNFHCALPILRELKVPATVFLATAYLDTSEPFPFDDWSAAGSANVHRDAWMPLTSSQCDEMLDSGLIELAAHTHTHGDFRNNPEFLEADLSECLAVLNSRFGIAEPTFAFPYGTRKLGYSGPALSDVARKVGTLCALSTESRTVRPGADPFDWGRFTAEGSDTAATLAAKLDGWYECLLARRRAFEKPVATIA